MAGELQDIVDELVLIETAITPPVNQKDAHVYDEPPTGVVLFPSFVNIEKNGDESQAPSLRSGTVFIDIHLLFAKTDQKYNWRERRPWLKKVLDAFDAAVRLNNNQPPVQYSRIETYEFDQEIELPGNSDSTYIGITFHLRAWSVEGFIYDV